MIPVFANTGLIWCAVEYGYHYHGHVARHEIYNSSALEGARSKTRDKAKALPSESISIYKFKS